MSLAVGTDGIPVYMPAGCVSSNPYATLFGRPVIPIEQCSALGTKGDIILGDFQNGYVIADKGSVKEDISIHIRYVFDESCYRFVYRLDGQPVLGSAVTPYSGSDTLGHFVVLETRS